MSHSALQPMTAWGEERATPRCDPSAEPGAKTGAGIGRSCSIPLPFHPLGDSRQSDRASRHDAAIRRAGRHHQIANVKRQKLQFPLNQDNGRNRHANADCRRTRRQKVQAV